MMQVERLKLFLLTCKFCIMRWMHVFLLLLLQSLTNSWSPAPAPATCHSGDTCLCLAQPQWGCSSPWGLMKRLEGGLRALFLLTVNLCLLLT